MSRSAAGRLTDEIHENLTTVLDEIQAESDHDEEKDEPLLDTLDRLIGFCRAELAYQNPPATPAEAKTPAPEGQPTQELIRSA